MSRIGKYIETQNMLVVTSTRGSCGLRSLVANGYGVSPWGDENILKLLWWWLHVSVHRIKTINYKING